ncbi:hypothetical protein MIND_00383700 [Mycena indigotica]|uniref:Uncharacterized protein n=1 Tax=Mycena indigotica TaxID=2126181 RepID=A0A8H6WF31_9AGAR|nr:uncharacterized protein MIND_00383700 [Mycena indigotica]KAF7310104.1 hypothetical protein MIND_00383700 [Mycena indigotica]
MRFLALAGARTEVADDHIATADGGGRLLLHARASLRISPTTVVPVVHNAGATYNLPPPMKKLTVDIDERWITAAARRFPMRPPAPPLIRHFKLSVPRLMKPHLVQFHDAQAECYGGAHLCKMHMPPSPSSSSQPLRR